MSRKKTITCVTLVTRLMKIYDEPDRRKMNEIVCDECINTIMAKYRKRSWERMWMIRANWDQVTPRHITLSSKDQEQVMRRIRRKYIKVN